jgi:hypothetical protein
VTASSNFEKITRFGVEIVIDEDQPIDLRCVGWRTGDRSLLVDLIDQHLRLDKATAARADVVTQGEYITKGTAVRVLQVGGTRVIVARAGEEKTTS